MKCDWTSSPSSDDVLPDTCLDDAVKDGRCVHHMKTPRCFYFGCWNRAGHFLFAPGGDSVIPDERRLVYYGDHIHLDSSLAPKSAKPGTRTHGKYGTKPVYEGMGATKDERSTLHYDTTEFPQGYFILHYLSTGFTAMQWWDRTQGDIRGACNSTILLEGKRNLKEMHNALKEHFPHVLANLQKQHITLTEVFL